jgi:chromosome segregation ATPase
LKAGVVAALAALVAWPVLAQQPQSREQEQIRRLRQQVQQLQAQVGEQSQAQAKAAQQAAAQQARADAAAAAQQQSRKALAASEKLGKATQQELVDLQKEHTALQAEMTAVKAQAQATQAGLQAARAEQATLRQRVSAGDAQSAELDTQRRLQASDLRACVLQRQALDDLSAELLTRLSQRSPVTAFAQEEPFLQFGRVQQENLVQGYTDRLRAIRLKAPEPAASPPASPERAR